MRVMPDAPDPGSSADERRKLPQPRQTNRRDRLERLAPLAEQQVRVVSRAQLRALRWTPQQIIHEIRFGRWHLASPHVVALQNAPLSGDQLLWLGVLHAGPEAAVSHLTACRHHGLRWKADDTVHVLVPKGHLVSPLDNVVFHQTRRRYRDWVHHDSGGLPVVDLEAAVLLTAERDDYLRRAIGLLAAAVQQGLTSAERLLLTKPRIRKLRHGRQFVLALGDIAGGAQSFAEIDIGRLCREVGLAEPVRQRVRRDRDGRRRYLDCEWELPDGRVVVLEIDGSFHMRTEHWWRDMRRERHVVLSGRTVLRCASVELRLEPSEVLLDLRAAGVPRAHRTAA